MATYTVPLGGIGTPAFTLTANTVDTVTFDGDLRGGVEIITDGSAEVWYTTGATAPTVGGSNCYYLPAALAVATTALPSDSDTIQFISSGTPKLRVQKP